MNGAHALMRTLVGSGVTTCFTNLGRSEMHFVAALDSAPEMRAVLALFEGVATVAADGYARMADRPAATLLHFGPGLGNGLANLHNTRKGKVPVLDIVGDHATYPVRYDASLQSDIETVARNVSDWVRTSRSTGDLAGDAAEAISAAQGAPGQVATLILPADVSWGTPRSLRRPPSRRRRPPRSSMPPPERDSCEELLDSLERAIAGPGPHLIEAVIPSVYSGLALRARPYALRALTVLPGPVAKAVKRQILP